MRPRIGVAIEATRLHAAAAAGSATQRFEWPLPPFGADEWSAALRAAFAGLRESTGLRSAAVSVAVLPPLCRARALRLPPLSLEQCRRVLTRDAKRYFLGRGPWLIAVRRLRSRGATEPNVLAVAIPSGVYDGLVDAAASVGWSIRAVVPAEEAWCSAIPRGRRGPGLAVVRMESGTHLIEVERGGWRPGRRLRDSQEPETGDATVHLDVPATQAGTLAAECAHCAGRLSFVPEPERAQMRARAARLTRRLWAVAAGLLLLAGGAAYLDLSLELSSVRARRAARAVRVDSALRTEEAITRLEETVAALSTSAPAQAGWGELLTEVTMNLPEDAYLTAFGGEADSVALAGIAEDAGSVLETLRNAPSLRGVRLEAPIRQESRPGEVPVERFVVAAKLSQVPGGGGGGPR